MQDSICTSLVYDRDGIALCGICPHTGISCIEREWNINVKKYIESISFTVDMAFQYPI